MNHRLLCPLCNSRRNKTLEIVYPTNKNFYDAVNNNYGLGNFLIKNNYYYELNLCKCCGTRYQTVFLNEMESSKFYSENIQAKKSFIKQVINYKRNLNIRLKTGKIIERFLKSSHKNSFNVLEVGAGWGFFAYVNSQPNLKFTTLEIGEDRKILHKLLDLKRIESLEEAIDLGLKFDAIYSNQVIEHLPNLSKFVKTCDKLLEKGGFFIAECPSYNNFIHYLFQKKTYYGDMRTKALEHLQLISDKGAKELFKNIDSLEYIKFFPIRKLGDRLRYIIQLLTSSKSKGSGFIVAKKIK